jgi:hypothetical protein
MKQTGYMNWLIAEINECHIIDTSPQVRK